MFHFVEIVVVLYVIIYSILLENKGLIKHVEVSILIKNENIN